MEKRQARDVVKRSRVTIQFEMECDANQLLNDLRELLDDLEHLNVKTIDFYENTKEQLKNLLESAISEIELKGPQEGTAQNEPFTSFGCWEGTVTLYTLPQHHHPDNNDD